MSARAGREAARGTSGIPRELETGFAHHKAGRYDRAEASYRRVLRKTPENVEALSLLGVIAHERGHHEFAIQLLSRALANRPDFADAHLTLGRAQFALGRPDEAAASYRRAIALNPDLALAHCNLSGLLSLQGAHEAALESADRAAALMPDLAPAYANRGVALGGLRRFSEAEAAFRKALLLAPNTAEVLTDLGQMMTELKRYDEAIACHQQAVALQPENAIAHYRLAAALFYAGDPYGSEASCRRAVTLKPDFAVAWSGLGQILKALGRFDEARSCFVRATEADPESADAHAGLAMMGHRTGGEEQLDRLRALVASPERLERLRIDAGFALGMLLDNADRCDEAFAAFAAANTLHRQWLAASGATFDPVALRQHVDSLIASCTPELYSSVEGEGNPSDVPVFIVGMPRSGTSLVEQIAASHSRVYGAGELKDIAAIVEAVQEHGRSHSADDLDPDLAGRLADQHEARLRLLGRGAARVIDKMPDNIVHLGFIAVLFPGARVIFCRRDNRDTCLSCFFSRFDDAIAWSCDLGDCGIRATEIERLADHLRKVLPLRMLTIDYETLVADLEGQSRRLIDFLGLDWEPACLEFHKTNRPVLTASGWQVRQPLYTHSVGRWRRYERHLGPLLGVLEQNQTAV
ncbi:MAG: tetratricopeptide repeat protein [Stellaceae bacterium]